MVYVVHPTGKCCRVPYFRAMKKVLAISGSIRASSSNHQLLQAIAAMMASRLDVVIFDGVGTLPHFDPGLADAPAPVAAFRRLLRESDGVIICTPEYAHGVPGSLKNAIDWTVSSGEFSAKPTALITASTDGRFGHQALLEILNVIEARTVSLLIPFVRSKVNASTGVVEEQTLGEIRRLMDEFIKLPEEIPPSIP